MKLIPVFLFSLLPLFYSDAIHAEESGNRRFVMDVAVSGFFSPEVNSAVIISIEPGSNAEKSGMKIGDSLIAVYDCAIPGCPAGKAKKLLEKKTGETTSLHFRRQDETEYTVELVLE